MSDQQPINLPDFELLPADIKDKVVKVNPQGVDLYKLEYDSNIAKGAIPNRNDPAIQATFSQNRLLSKYAGAVQLGKQKERKELKELLLQDSIIKYLNAKNNGTVNKATMEVIDYIPNSRFAYYNKLIKTGLREGLSACDIDVVNNVWMSPENIEKLKTLLGTMINNSKDSFTLMPSTRSGLKYVCKGGFAKPDFYNPGTIDLPHQHGYELGCGCSNEKIAHELADINSHVNKILAKYQAEYAYAEDDNIIEEYFGHDVRQLLHWSREMALTGKVDLKRLVRLTQAFHNLNQVQKSSYMMSLINPFEYNQEVRIPAVFPVPTAAFSVARNISLTTNNKGNVAFAINPYYFATSNTSCSVNNDATLDGVTASNFFLGVDLGQAMPVPFYTRYRLVSASVRVIFTSSTLNSTGFATMSVDFDQGAIAAVGTAIAQYAKYANFSQVENGFFKQTKAVTNGNSMQVNFLPVDTSMQEFSQIGGFLNGYIIAGYITGAPVSSTIARLDTVFNYEAFVNQTYSDYIPSAANNNGEDIDECKMFINNCQIRRYVTPEDMYKVLPDKNKEKKKEDIILPEQPVQIVTPVAKENVAETLKQVGKDIVTTIIEDKLKTKPITDKFDIVDKFDKLTPQYLKFDKFDKGLGSSIASGVAASGILGTLLGVGSKLLPFV